MKARRKQTRKTTPSWWLKQMAAHIRLTEGQQALVKKHGTPAEFAEACYAAVPSDISMDEAGDAVAKYQAEWAKA